MERPDFWDRPDRARAAIERSKRLKEWTRPWLEISQKVDELLELARLLSDEPDEKLLEEIEVESKEIDRRLGELELRNMLRGPDAHRDALLTVHPGAGGTESQDWAEMLLRMYTRWAESRGFELEVLDLLPGE
jgi:peptide chain release factor 2